MESAQEEDGSEWLRSRSGVPQAVGAHTMTPCAPDVRHGNIGFSVCTARLQCC